MIIQCSWKLLTQTDIRVSYSGEGDCMFALALTFNITIYAGGWRTPCSVLSCTVPNAKGGILVGPSNTRQFCHHIAAGGCHQDEGAGAYPSLRFNNLTVHSRNMLSTFSTEMCSIVVNLMHNMATSRNVFFPLLRSVLTSCLQAPGLVRK